jgi:hypothetical protein
MYGAINLESAEAAFESLKEKWGSDYPGAVRVKLFLCKLS